MHLLNYVHFGLRGGQEVVEKLMHLTQDQEVSGTNPEVEKNQGFRNHSFHNTLGSKVIVTSVSICWEGC